MNMQQTLNTNKQVLIIERDINFGAVKTVSQLLARTGKANLPHSVYSKLLKVMQDKVNSSIPMFLRKQAF